MILARALFVAAVLLATSSAAPPAAAGPYTERGKALVTATCARCHAVGREGSSPHLSAPALRNIDQRVDLDEMVNRLREGLMAAHEDMPVFHFNREDARAIAAYLRSIQGP